MSKSAPRQSTIKLFTYIQICMLALFVIVTLFTLTRLSEVHNSLERLTVETVPAINDARTISHKIDQLMSLTVSLSYANNQPTRRIINQRINETINQLNAGNLAQNQDNTFLYTQVTALTQELDELDSMVEQRIRIEERLERDRVAFFDKIQVSLVAHQESSEYQRGVLTEIMLLAVQIEQQDRLHQLRQVERQLEQKFTRTFENERTPHAFSRELNDMFTMLLGSNGIVNQKIESLRVTGRTRGRGNFVKNLVEDVASNLEHSSRLTFRRLQDDADRTESRIQLQSQIALIAGTITVILTLIMIYYLHRRIVFRLLSLKMQIDKAANQEIEKVEVKGKDEIAHLADTFSLYIDKVRQQEVALVNMSLTDPLTNIPNRRAFDKHLDAEITQATRQRWPLSILLIDVDFFKYYNDHYGHAEGDTCLKIVAKTLNEIVLRGTDFCARYGGEEFVCVLPNTDSEGAKYKAEELRLAIEELKIDHARSDIGDYITISIGAATFPFSSHRIWSHDAVIEHTDAALYKAKNKGRNCFVHTVIG